MVEASGHRKRCLTSLAIRKIKIGDFPCGPVVKNLPSSARDVGSIPGRETKIPHAAGQLNSHAATKTREKPPMKSPRTAKKTQHSQKIIIIIIKIEMVMTY